VLDGDQAPSPKRGRRPPPFSAHFYYSQTVGCINIPLGMEIGLSPGNIVLDGDLAPSPKRGAEPLRNLRFEVENLEIGPRLCVALEQEIILVKTRSE